MADYFNARTLVLSWLIGFVVAGLALSVGQRKTARDSCWGSSPWQNEIAIWNLGGTLILAGALMHGQGIEAMLLPGLFALSLAFAINHIVAIRRHPDKRYPTNLAAATSNGIGVIAILVYYARTLLMN